jgi:bis(5'-nucleosyl)-tetraphosphatase (symmetrical)
MAVWVIGDVQGCYKPLQKLLEKIEFDPGRDRLWFTGDLVNRGPKSAKVLRFVRNLGDSAITVLGNHDLHLLAIASGHSRRRGSDTLKDVLDAPDRDELLDWLRFQPLMHSDPELGYTMVHAGLLPEWTIRIAQKMADDVEAHLRADNYADFFPHMYGDKPNHWHPRLEGWDRLRLITNTFTRLRFCDVNGYADFYQKGNPSKVSKRLIPWFAVPGRRSQGTRIVFGHWSTLGLVRGEDYLCLDTGCLWGGKLSAARLDVEGAPVMMQKCKAQQTPN